MFFSRLQNEKNHSKDFPSYDLEENCLITIVAKHNISE